MRKIPRLILAISRSTNWIADLANVRAVPALNLVVVGPSLRRIRAVSPRAETRARTRVSLPRGREGEQGSDGGRRTKSQAVPQSLARGDGRGRSTGGREGGRKMRSFDLGTPAGVDVRDAERRFAIRLLVVRCTKRIAILRWKWFNPFRNPSLLVLQ